MEDPLASAPAVTDPSQPPIEATRAYLLGAVPTDDAFAFQRRLAYDVAGDPRSAALILCDHPFGVSIGREGSRAHVRLSQEKLSVRRWSVRYVGRGGGCILHVPGQVACYPIVSLRSLGLTPVEYVSELCRVVADVVAGFGASPAVDAAAPAVRVRGRRIASIGVGVRDWVTSFGVVLNVAPDLAWFRDVDSDGDPMPMTSLQRECPDRVRESAVRQRLLELLTERFRFGRVSVFHSHPTMPPRALRHAISTAR